MTTNKKKNTKTLTNGALALLILLSGFSGFLIGFLVSYLVKWC